MIIRNDTFNTSNITNSAHLMPIIEIVIILITCTVIRRVIQSKWIWLSRTLCTDKLGRAFLAIISTLETFQSSIFKSRWFATTLPVICNECLPIYGRILIAGYTMKSRIICAIFTGIVALLAGFIAIWIKTTIVMG